MAELVIVHDEIDLGLSYDCGESRSTSATPATDRPAREAGCVSYVTESTTGLSSRRTQTVTRGCYGRKANGCASLAGRWGDAKVREAVRLHVRRRCTGKRHMPPRTYASALDEARARPCEQVFPIAVDREAMSRARPKPSWASVYRGGMG